MGDFPILWTESDTFACNGRDNQQRYVNIWPWPVQKPHPPVWRPGGAIATWQWCAKRDNVYAYLSSFGSKDGRATMPGFWDEMARLGKDRHPHRAGCLPCVGVAESRAKTMELYRALAAYCSGRCRRGSLNRRRAPACRARAAATTRLQTIGAPGEVVEQLPTVATARNVGHPMRLLQCGSRRKKLAQDNTKRLSEKVMPHLCGLFSA